MNADGYVGSAEDSARIRRMDKKRNAEKEHFNKMKQQRDERLESAGLRKFGASTSEQLEHAFKNETIGLVTKAEFVQKRTTLQERLEEEMKKKLEEDEELVVKDKERRRKEKMMGAGKPKLSFAMDDQQGTQQDMRSSGHRITAEQGHRRKAEQELQRTPGRDTGEREAGARREQQSQGKRRTDEEGDGEEDGAGAIETKPAFSFKFGCGAAASTSAPKTQDSSAPKTQDTDIKGGGDENNEGSDGGATKKPRFGKFGKDPSVATAFLPDKDREKAEEELRNQLKKEWMAQQEAIRQELLDITYSYWDGSGHRHKISVKKGDSEYEGGSGSPQHVSFYDLIISKAQGKSGSLFDFGVTEDIRIVNDARGKSGLLFDYGVTEDIRIVNDARGKSGPLFDFGVTEDIRIVNDATQEKKDSHAGKIVERHWYDRNKHIFPANRWEPFDPDKKWDSYSIHDYKDKH
eukprot:gene26756-4333_t